MKKLLISLVALVAVGTASAQEVALKSNLASLALGGVNVGAEFSISPKWTISSDVTLMAYNAWGKFGAIAENSSFYANGWIGTVELRYYTCEAMNGHHFGLYLAGSKMGEFSIKSKLFGSVLTGSKYANVLNLQAGFLGLSYGYYLKLYHGWGLDFYVGGGLAYARFLELPVETYIPYLFNGNTKCEWQNTGLTYSILRCGIDLSYKF